jgi:hypothetical protein
MSGAKMNQVIGSRLDIKSNKETQPNVGKLNATGLKDLVLGEVYRKAEASTTSLAGGPGGGEGEKEALEAFKEKNFLTFLGKLGQYPHVDIRAFKRGSERYVKSGFDVNKILYVASFDDRQLQKLGKKEFEGKEDVSVLLPINFTFTIHGISGIKRGDKFGVVGIPKKYEDNGFFQVIGIKHTIQGMEWNTEVTGGYRNFKGLSLP